MRPDDIVITGIGMVTPVGLTPAETSASVRANVMRLTEIPWRDDRFEPFVVGEVLEDGLPDLAATLQRDSSITHREARLLRLGSEPLRQALRTMPENQPVKPTLIVALPEHDTTQPIDPALFLERLSTQTGGAFDASTSVADYRGRAGGLSAIGQAARTLRSGAARFVLAGGIDSFRDPYILGVLMMKGRIKTSTNLDAFVPGEAAAFLLLSTRATAASAGIAPIGAVSAVTAGLEPGHLYSEQPYRGEGLAAVVRQLLDQAPDLQPLREVYSSMNGESHWAKEWGVTFLRNKDAFDPATGIHHPADCYGDTGAASGPLLAGLAALGMLQNFRRSPALIYCSSDFGERSAAAIAAERN